MPRKSSNASNKQSTSMNQVISPSSSVESNFGENIQWWRNISSYNTKRKSILQKNTETLLNQDSDASNLSENWWRNLSKNKLMEFTKPPNIPSDSSENEPVVEEDLSTGPIPKKLFAKPWKSPRRFSKAFEATRTEFEVSVEEGNSLTNSNLTSDLENTSVCAENKKLFAKPRKSPRRFSKAFEGTQTEFEEANTLADSNLENTSACTENKKLFAKASEGTQTEFEVNFEEANTLTDSNLENTSACAKNKKLFANQSAKRNFSLAFEDSSNTPENSSNLSSKKSKSEKLENPPKTPTSARKSHLTPKNLFNETRNLENYKSCFVQLEMLSPPELTAPENLETLQRSLFRKKRKTGKYSRSHNSSKIDDDNIETPPRKYSTRISRLNTTNSRTSKILEMSINSYNQLSQELKCKTPEKSDLEELESTPETTRTKHAKILTSTKLENSNKSSTENLSVSIIEKIQLENSSKSPLNSNKENIEVATQMYQDSKLENTEKTPSLNSRNSNVSRLESTLEKDQTKSPEKSIHSPSIKTRNSSVSRLGNIESTLEKNQTKNTTSEKSRNSSVSRLETKNITLNESPEKSIQSPSLKTRNSSISRLEKIDTTKNTTTSKSSEKSIKTRIESPEKLSTKPESPEKPIISRISRLKNYESTNNATIPRSLEISKPENSSETRIESSPDKNSTKLKSPEKSIGSRISRIEKLESTLDKTQTINSTIPRSPEESKQENSSETRIESTPNKNSTKPIRSRTSRLEKIESTPNEIQSINSTISKSPEKLEVDNSSETRMKSTPNKNFTKPIRSRISRLDKHESTLDKNQKNNSTILRNPEESKPENSSETRIESSPDKNSTKLNSPEKSVRSRISRLEKLESTLDKNQTTYSTIPRSPEKSKQENSGENRIESTPNKNSIKPIRSRTSRLENVESTSDEIQSKNSTISRSPEKSKPENSSETKIESTPNKNSSKSKSAEKPIRSRISKLEMLESTPDKNQTKNTTISRSPEKSSETRTESTPNKNSTKPGSPEKPIRSRISRLEEFESTPDKNQTKKTIPVSPEKSSETTIESTPDKISTKSESPEKPTRPRISGLEKHESSPDKNQTKKSTIPRSPEKSKPENSSETRIESTKLKIGDKPIKSRISRLENLESTPDKNETKNSAIPRSPEKSRPENSSETKIESSPEKNKTKNITTSKSPEKSKLENTSEIENQTEIITMPQSPSLRSKSRRISKLETTLEKNQIKTPILRKSTTEVTNVTFIKTLEKSTKNRRSKRLDLSKTEDTIKMPENPTRSNNLDPLDIPENDTFIIENNETRSKSVRNTTFTKTPSLTKSKNLDHMEPSEKPVISSKWKKIKRSKNLELSESKIPSNDITDSKTKPQKRLTRSKNLDASEIEKLETKKINTPEKSKNSSIHETTKSSKNLEPPQFDEPGNKIITPEKLNENSRSSNNLELTGFDEIDITTSRNTIKTPEKSKKSSTHETTQSSKNLEPPKFDEIQIMNSGNKIKSPEKSKHSSLHETTKSSKNLEPPEFEEIDTTTPRNTTKPPEKSKKSSLHETTMSSKNLEPPEFEEIDPTTPGNIIETAEKSKNTTHENAQSSKNLDQSKTRKSLKRKLFDAAPNESIVERRKSILKSPFRTPQRTEKKSVMFSDTFTIHKQVETNVEPREAKRRRSIFSDDSDWSEKSFISSTKLNSVPSCSSSKTTTEDDVVCIDSTTDKASDKASDQDSFSWKLIQKFLAEPLAETEIETELIEPVEDQTTDFIDKEARKQFEQAVRKKKPQPKKPTTNKSKPKKTFYQKQRWYNQHLFAYCEKKMKTMYPEEALKSKINDLLDFMAESVQIVRRAKKNYMREVTILKKELARNDIVKTHFDFFCFVQDFLPIEYRKKVIPCTQAYTAKPTVEFDETILYDNIL